MPRNQRATTAVAERPRTRNSGGGTGNELPLKPPRAKRAAEENINSNAKSRKRAAFGDLTNAVSERQSSLTKQVKKGLSNIVNKSRTSKATANSTASEVNAKKLKLALANSKLRKTKEAEEFSDSLPSSQESVQISPDPELESEYESAEENINEDTFVQRYEPPARPVPPPGVEDFDLINWNDPNQCSEYAMDIFYYYKAREAEFKVPDYISKQKEVTKTMRAILVDWLVEVQESFELNHETLYTAVKIMDLYMSNVEVDKRDLQLVGATACLIACKIDERIPPCLDDFVYVCDDAYNRTQIKAKEREVLEAVGFDVGYPLSYRFVRRYGRVCKASMSVLTYARYVLETSLLEYKFNVEMSESKMAAAALVLAFKVNQVKDKWVNTLAFYSGYTLADLQDLVQQLLQMLQAYPKENLKTVRQKYSHKVFHEVATIPLPENIDFELNEEEDSG